MMDSRTTTTIRFRISGKSMFTIDGSSISLDPVQYDGGSRGARDAFEALTAARPRRAGRGTSYVVETTREGADTIRDYCSTVGETFAGETDPETRADGRALLATAERIAAALR